MEETLSALAFFLLITAQVGAVIAVRWRAPGEIKAEGLAPRARLSLHRQLHATP